MSNTPMLTLPDITPDKLENLQYDTNARKKLLQQIITSYETRYGFTLSELEKKLNTLEINEHPAWEDSIEWRNVIEQLERIELSESIFQWLQSLLTQSATS